MTEGAECGPMGVTASFADGATAYCARLQYTDGAAWSRNPELAPNTAVPIPEPTGPSIGDRCIGADIGKTAIDANGTPIMCDNHRWVIDQGQEPSHPWADGQREWAECTAIHTADECREMLHG